MYVFHILKRSSKDFSASEGGVREMVLRAHVARLQDARVSEARGPAYAEMRAPLPEGLSPNPTANAAHPSAADARRVRPGVAARTRRVGAGPGVRTRRRGQTLFGNQPALAGGSSPGLCLTVPAAVLASACPGTQARRGRAARPQRLCRGRLACRSLGQRSGVPGASPWGAASLAATCKRGTCRSPENV